MPYTTVKLNEILALLSGSSQAVDDLTIAGDVTVTGATIIATATPASAAAAGVAGTIAWDGSYLYVCSATDTWLRVGIATW